MLNLSFSAEPVSLYWDDPLNQAVMAAWQSGLVVVAAAGNGGPNPGTIGVPGDVPYIVTVGALSDGFTPVDPADDYLTTFSSAGPTDEAHIKPDLVAPGGHILGLMDWDDTFLGSFFPEARRTFPYFEISGTSPAAAIVSGVVALMLEDAPQLTPDEVKCKLIASALPAVDGTGDLAYSVFQQGAGLVDAAGATINPQSGCANQGLDIGRDLSGAEHYVGPVQWNAVTQSLLYPGNR